MTTPPHDNEPSASARKPLAGVCAEELARLTEAGLLRQLKTVEPRGRHITHNGKRLLNLASNDYLGLSQHPKLIEAATDATRR